MSLTAFNRMRRVLEEKKKADKVDEPKEVKEEVVIAEDVEPEVKEKVVEEKEEKPTRRNRRNAE